MGLSRRRLALLVLTLAAVAGCATSPTDTIDPTTAVGGSPEGGATGDGGVADPDASTGPGAQTDTAAPLPVATDAGSAGEGGAACVPPPASPVDPTTLPACSPMCNGAHCLPSADVPASVQGELAACSGGFCVPDQDIMAGTLLKPPSCTSLSNAPGVCLSVCIPQVAMYVSLLPQATCATDERCAPCVNPITMQSSGACEIGAGPVCGSDGGTVGEGGSSPPPPPVDAAPVCPHTGPPVIDPSSLPACGSGGAHCLPSALVPPAEASQLATCPTGYCVPDVFIESGGEFIPPTCTSLDGAEGRCLNVALPQIAAQTSLLPQGSCQSYERCAPCYSPIDGTVTGACSQGCDPGPTQPKVVFQACCTPDGANTPAGKCVPSSVIPSSEQSDLDQDECTDSSSLCVPTEMLSPGFMPQTCSASGFLIGDYTGVCLSTCLDFGLESLALDQGNCDDIHQCVPCTNPLTGDPTGAPGC
jgi:hypothetical protein